MEYDAIKARIVAACDWAIAEGYKIVPGTWGCEYSHSGIKAFPQKEICPMAALVLHEKVSPSCCLPCTANTALGGENFLKAFIGGFDGGERALWIYYDQKAYALGLELRAKYVTLPHQAAA